MLVCEMAQERSPGGTRYVVMERLTCGLVMLKSLAIVFNAGK